MAFVLCWALRVPTLAAVDVAEVRVRKTGPGPLDRGYVLTHVSVHAGESFDRGRVSRDVKRLQKTERFALVTVEVEETDTGLILTYVVQNKLRIHRIRIHGATRLSERKILALLAIKEGDLVDEASLAVAALKVEAEYREIYHPYARVVPRLVLLDESAGTADVHMDLHEGARAVIRRIVFHGNTAISSKTLLKRMRRKRWLLVPRFLRKYRYDEEQVELWMEVIRATYRDEGYLNVELEPARYEEYRRGRLILHLGVKEGARHRIGTVRLTGASVFEEAALQRVTRLKTGAVASLAAIQAAAGRLRDYYGARGYIHARASYVLAPRAGEPEVVEITFRITEGGLVRIRDIEIRGNTVTKDKVIRRELLVCPGDEYNTKRVGISTRRLRNLGYFSFVNSYPEPTAAADESDLVFELEEQRTGQLMLGVGFSSVENFLAFVELTQGNFDLKGWPVFRGGGQKLRLRAQLGDKRSDYELSFVEPWFLERRLSLSMDLFAREIRYLSSEYNQRRRGGAVGLGKALGRFSRVHVKYGLEEIDIYDVGEGASDLIKEEEGRRTKSSVRVTVSADMRDSVFVPTRGGRYSVSAELAGGMLGFDTDLYGLEARAAHYIPLWFRHVLCLRARAVVVKEYGGSDRVPIFDRLFLGGAREMRGFDFREAGPKDAVGEPIGGRTAAVVAAEYAVPLAEKVRLVGFAEAGNVWEDAFDFDLSKCYTDVGLGVRFDLPGFPMRLDWGWPIENEVYEGDDTSKAPEFHFSLGYAY